QPDAVRDDQLGVRQQARVIRLGLVVLRPDAGRDDRVDVGPAAADRPDDVGEHRGRRDHLDRARAWRRAGTDRRGAARSLTAPRDQECEAERDRDDRPNDVSHATPSQLERPRSYSTRTVVVESESQSASATGCESAVATAGTRRIGRRGASQAAIAVVAGTARRIPMLPTRARTTSTAISSSFTVRLNDSTWIARTTSSGSAAPR